MRDETAHSIVLEATSPRDCALSASSLVAADAAFLSGPLAPRPHANLGVKDEPERHSWPTRVLRKRVVKLGREFAQRGQSGPGNGWEIVVLIVVSHLHATRVC